VTWRVSSIFCMAVAYSLIPGLDDIVKYGDSKRRGDALRKISDLFLQGAAGFLPEHVDLFDGILLSLLPRTEIEARSELAQRICELVNAPPLLVRQLVRDDEAAISGPLLRGSPLIDDPTLIEIARLKSQLHLLAIAERSTLSSPITDVIVRRGDREVVRRVAGNAGAHFSQAGYSGLIRRAGEDGVLALAVGQRDDLSAAQLKDLLERSVEVVRRRLFEAAKPEAKAAINRVLAEITGIIRPHAGPRDFAPAQRAVVKLHHAGELNEAALLGFAQANQYEETIAALSALSSVRIATVDNLITGERHDPILILGKSIGLEWVTVRALIGLRLGPPRGTTAPDLDEARANFERLVPSTAQRVLGFWRMREPGMAAGRA
jgi:uncharacterized protein (DUF2336 family)